MNMKQYYKLLNLRRFVNQTSPVLNSHHLYRHPQPPSRPQPPPSIFSSRNGIGSHSLFLNSNHHRFQVSKSHTSEPSLYENDLSRHDYPVTVKGIEVISAAVSPASEHWLPLSNLDLLLPPIDSAVFFCYKKKNDIDMSTQTVVDTIKKSLAGVLSTYYPLAGEIVQNRHGEPEVVCNNNGVEFVHAHVDVELKDLDFYHPRDSLDGKLVPKINRGVLSVQVTELKCGSIVLSFNFNHQVSDAYSMSMFLTAWAKYAQSGKMPNIPSFRTSMFNPRRPPNHTTSFDNLYLPLNEFVPPPPSSSFEEPYKVRMYYVRAESIQHIQSEAKRSKLLSFTAYLWKLLADGSGDDVASAISRMGVIVNGRRFLTEGNEKSSSLFLNHYGNVLSVPLGVTESSELKAMQLDEVATRVHEFVTETTNEEHFRGLIDWIELHRPTPVAGRIYLPDEKSEGNALVVTSGRDLPINDMDFGWGKPEFGAFHIPGDHQTGLLQIMPSANRNGDWVVYLRLKEKQLDVVERMAPNVFTPLSLSTLL